MIRAVDAEIFAPLTFRLCTEVKVTWVCRARQSQANSAAQMSPSVNAAAVCCQQSSIHSQKALIHANRARLGSLTSRASSKSSPAPPSMLAATMATHPPLSRSAPLCRQKSMLARSLAIRTRAWQRKFCARNGTVGLNRGCSAMTLQPVRRRYGFNAAMNYPTSNAYHLCACAMGPARCVDCGSWFR